MGQARLRVNLMPQHTRDQLDKFVEIFEASLDQSNKIYEKQM
jgi:glycine C-acetyltransferase